MHYDPNINRRSAEILDEVRAEREAETTAAELELPADEAITGVAQVRAARARLAAAGLDPDTVDEGVLLEALAAVGPQTDDVIVRVVSPAPEPESVVGADLDRAARSLLVRRGLEDTEENYLAALREVGAA